MGHFYEVFAVTFSEVPTSYFYFLYLHLTTTLSRWGKGCTVRGFSDLYCSFLLAQREVVMSEVILLPVLIAQLVISKELSFNFNKFSVVKIQGNNCISENGESLFGNPLLGGHHK